MKKRKLKPFVVPMMYAVSILMLVGSVFAIEKLVNNALFKGDAVDYVDEVEEVIYNSDEDEYDYNANIPVIGTETIIRRPYTNSSVAIVKNYYDYQAEASRQEESIVYYGNTYMQNSGVDYGMDAEFEVVSIMDGTVIEVVDDDIMGKTVKVKHSNDLISVYQSLSSYDVEKDEVVTQGMIIGKSGEANVSVELGNHLHFELYHKGSVVNPENYFDKSVSDLD